MKKKTNEQKLVLKKVTLSDLSKSKKDEIRGGAVSVMISRAVSSCKAACLIN